ncbi:hypothetical protein F751_2564 [Auxenochlorella protothecoides]|uniref:Uncharacterized protein n=1 Tax=Auxenochlorella protothecoides TaxID=3075 RepID=A0A087SJ18_AUXPR|nr:hypothetical protein F751_2564 [Auxenochlorella protothecoides]KFM25722.1 hypothetical protein F751_2564 [Auxenochlorella protothecoides]
MRPPLPAAKAGSQEQKSRAALAVRAAMAIPALSQATTWPASDHSRAASCFRDWDFPRAPRETAEVWRAS